MHRKVIDLSHYFSLFLWLSTYLPAYLPIYLSIYLSLSLCVCLSIYLSINLSIWLCVVVFYVLRATTACNFSALIWPDGSAPAALASLLFDSPEPRCIEKHSDSQLLYLFAHLHLLSSHSFSSLILSLLLFFSSPLWLFPPLPFHLSMHFCQFQPRVNHISGSISTGNFSVYSMAGLRSEKTHNPGKIAVRKDTQSNRNNGIVLQKWNRTSTSELYAIAHVCRTSLVTFKQHTLEHVIGLN